MRPDIVPGAVFPDYELSDHRGKHRTLSELQGGDPLVLVLSRGGFCPKERRQHEGLLHLHREMQVGYCRLVTISADNLLETNEFRSGVGAHWTFLSDPGRKVQKDLDIAEYTDPHHNPMIPHTLVLEPGLRGQPPGAAHGIDVDDQGNGTVAEQRLYQLIRQPGPIADRQFEIEFLDPGVEAFAFTFG
jgi:peroxiredoxin